MLICNSVARSFSDPHEQRFLRGHEAKLNCLTLSRRGTLLASGDSQENSDIVVWDFVTQSVLWRFSEHDGGVGILSFSDDERLLLSVGVEDHRLVIWDLKTGMLVTSTDLPKQIGVVRCAAWGGFSKNAKRRDTEYYQFATGGDSITLWALNPYSGELAMQTTDAKRNVRNTECLAFVRVPDSCGREGYKDEYLLSGTSSGDFVSYLVKPNKSNTFEAPEATFVKANPACAGGVHSLVADPTNGSNVIIGGGDGTIARFVYQLSDASWIDEEGTQVLGAVFGLAISNDGSEIVAGSNSGKVFRAKIGALAEPLHLCSNVCGPVTGITFAPTSSLTFATASKDGVIRVWSADDFSVTMETTMNGTDSSQRERKQSLEGRDFPTSISFAIDAVLSGWTDGGVRSHHAETGELLWVIKDAHIGGVSALKLSNNMRFVVSGGENGDVRVWEMRQRQLVSHLKEHTRTVTQIILFDDDVHAISCSKDKSFLTWDLRQDKRISAHTQRMGGIHAIALNHDQTIVITMGQERTISFWDLAAPHPIVAINEPKQGMHLDEATCIAVSNNGELFATGGMDCVVKLWVLKNGTPIPLSNNIGHTDTVSSIAFSYDDKQLISVGLDGAVFIWNIFLDSRVASNDLK